MFPQKCWRINRKYANTAIQRNAQGLKKHDYKSFQLTVIAFTMLKYTVKLNYKFGHDNVPWQ